MKGHEASITFHQKTWQHACLVFKLLAPKRPSQKLFSTLGYFSKNFIYYIIHAITLKCFHIIEHRYAASFLIKTRYRETRKGE